MDFLIAQNIGKSKNKGLAYSGPVCCSVGRRLTSQLGKCWEVLNHRPAPLVQHLGCERGHSSLNTVILSLGKEMRQASCGLVTFPAYLIAVIQRGQDFGMNLRETWLWEKSNILIAVLLTRLPLSWKPRAMSELPQTGMHMGTFQILMRKMLDVGEEKL